MVWVKFHDKLCAGAKRGLPRAVRFVFMELCLAARPDRGVMDLPVGMSDIDALHDVLGGSRKEIVDAMKLLTVIPKASADDPEPRAMVELTGELGARRLAIPSWSAWNSGQETPGASTERSRRCRQQRATPTGQEAQRSENMAQATDATGMQRPLHADAAVEQREGNGPATPYRGEERRGEEKREPPYPPLAGGARPGGQSALWDESVRAVPPREAKRAAAEKPAHVKYAENYAAGMRDATGQDFPVPRERAALIDMAKCYAKRDGEPITGDDLLSWFRHTAKEYRRVRAQKAEFEHGFAPHKCLEWLKAGRPAVLSSSGGRPLQTGAVEGCLPE